MIIYGNDVLHQQYANDENYSMIKRPAYLVSARAENAPPQPSIVSTLYYRQTQTQQTPLDPSTLMLDISSHTVLVFNNFVVQE